MSTVLHDQIREIRQAVEQLREELIDLREQLADLDERIPPIHTGSIKPAPAVELDAGQAAALMGVSRRHFVDRLSKHPSFPKPSTNVSNKTRLWRYADLLKVKTQSLRRARR